MSPASVAALEALAIPDELPESLIPDWSPPEWLALESTLVDPDDLSWERLIWGAVSDEVRDDELSLFQQSRPPRQLVGVLGRNAALRVDLVDSDELCAS